ncbi:hypothetical protein LZ31DRAFT_591716 [Colletotrichum somersetense]|nr:hypothetical protein LZ31DRAFT_591716 [Colletotrichum somersetense]
MGSACSSHAGCTVLKDDLTDPDIMGIGVLLAFVIPVLLSYVVVTLVYITRDTFEEDQYMEIDNRIIKWLERKSWVLAPIRRTKYRQIILGLSDQLLVTSFGILVAVYIQTCSKSLFCFRAGEALAYLSSGVHLKYLLALGSYFQEHWRQARFRIWLMAFLLVFILTNSFLTGFHKSMCQPVGRSAKRSSKRGAKRSSKRGAKSTPSSRASTRWYTEH